MVSSAIVLTQQLALCSCSVRAKQVLIRTNRQPQTRLCSPEIATQKMRAEMVVYDQQQSSDLQVALKQVRLT